MIAALALASPAASFVPAAPRADRRIRLGAGLSKTEVDAYVATVKAEVDAVAKARASGSADADAGADAPIAETTVDANGKAAPPTATPSNAKEQLRSLFGRKADPVLACPVSLEPLVTVNRFYGAAGAGMRQCEKFGTTYFSNGAYIDLVPKEASAEPFWQRGLQAVVQTDTFRNPVVAFLYERGWRQVREGKRLGYLPQPHACANGRRRQWLPHAPCARRVQLQTTSRNANNNPPNTLRPFTSAHLPPSVHL